MFLPGPSIPAKPRLGSLPPPVAFCGPETQPRFPRALLEPKLGWGGQENISALAAIQALLLHLVE